jgi:hypothetical protein
MAHSPEQSSGTVWKVLLGRLPGEKVEHGKAPVQQRHPYALQGMQRISRKGCVLLHRLCQGCASELPPALPHIPSLQEIHFGNGNKLNIFIDITNKILPNLGGEFLRCIGRSPASLALSGQRQLWTTLSSPLESIFRFHRHGGGQICPQKFVWNSHV